MSVLDRFRSALADRNIASASRVDRDMSTRDTSTDGGAYQVQKTDEQWRQELEPDRYAVLRNAGTEPPFTGAYVHDKTDGVYSCGACGARLFDASTKYDSGTGWPSFTEPAARDAVELVEDRAYGMARTEVRCARCGSHLGHLFPDGPGPAGERYCMNSASLDLEPRS